MRKILFACALVLAAAPARADDAESHFKRGVQFYQETDFKAAAIEFRRAYELSHRWGVLYNLAQAQFQALDYAGALGSFERYLADGGDRVPRARRAEVEHEIAKLRARVGRVTLQILPAGAEVAIDDVKIGTAPFDKEVLVSAGARKVAVSKDGFAPYTGTIEIAGGDAPKVQVTLEPLTPVAQPAPVQPVTPPPPPPHETHRVPWELWAISGGLAAAAAVTGVLALKASSDLDDDRARFGVTSNELSSGSSRVKAFSITSDVLVVSSLAVAGVALFLTLRPSGTKVGLGPRGAVVAGSF